MAHFLIHCSLQESFEKLLMRDIQPATRDGQQLAKQLERSQPLSFLIQRQLCRQFWKYWEERLWGDAIHLQARFW